MSEPRSDTMNERPLTALCAGHVTLDRYPDGLRIGGSAWYAARCFAALGFETTLVASVGEDFDRREWPEAFDQLACRLHAEGATTVFRNVYPKEGPRIQTVETIASPVRPVFRPSDTKPCRCDVLFLAPVIGEVDLDEWRAAVKPRLFGLGAQGWLKQPGPEMPEGGRRVIPRIWPSEPSTLHGVDLCCLSVEDLAGREDLLSRFVVGCPRVALTNGREGATLIEGSNRSHVASEPADELDPTGAGDTFAAGLLAGLARGMRLADAAQQGAKAAARVVEALGGDRLTDGRPLLF
jgi:1D-myo-inositol 3-kinase